ncbi:MAG: STAS domain-containing protein [Ruminococcaceae bacterium]|nr:STAS domain-containing protein [Oscillospiraceae bacterium]
MNQFKPMLFSTLKGYSGKQLTKDIVAGIIVAIIALPLSIALALASGVGPQEGLYTAIIAGFLISFFGGSTVQIAGPTAAFATIVAGIVAVNGMSGLALATIMAGVLLILMGICKFGNLIKFIPYTITTGFTAGIAVTILVGQLKDFLGLTYGEGVKPIETVEKVEAVAEHIGTINLWAVLVGVVSLAVLIIWPKINKVIPGSLIAVVVGIIMVKAFGLEVNTIGSLYTVEAKLPPFTVPEFSLDLVKKLLPDAFTIAVLAGIESLLSCVVADGMTGTKHRSNTELIAQGIGNIGSALFGGIPATGAIARTAANIKNGGRTPVAGMVHAIVLLLVLLVLMPFAAWIPMPTIAAILFMVAYNMCQWRPFVHLCKTAPAHDILVLVVTFVLTVVFDLVVAIEVGMILACILFIKRMSDETKVANSAPAAIPSDAKVYTVRGAMFFGAADKIAEIKADGAGTVIINMDAVPAMDATAMNAFEELYERLSAEDVKLVFVGVNEQPMRTMEKEGFIEKVGKDSFKDDMNAVMQAVNV